MYIVFFMWHLVCFVVSEKKLNSDHQRSNPMALNTEPKSIPNGGLEPSKRVLKSKLAKRAVKRELWDPAVHHSNL